MQTPHDQTGLLRIDKHPDRLSFGGGFGPVRLSFLLIQTS